MRGDMQNRPTRAARRSHKGQVLVIFGLMSIVLFVIAGLAVDAGMSYLASDRVERAAAAAALAGVAYLPGDYTSAQNAALVESARNGYTNAGSGNACTGNPSPCVITAQPATNQLQVTVSVSVNTTFLRLVGFGTHTVTRSATAEYLPPIQLGQPGSQQGSDMSTSCDGVGGTYCTNPGSGLGSGGSNYYFLRSEGWGNPRSEGDPFTPSPNEPANSCGPSSVSCVASPPDVHLVSPWDGTENSDATLNYVGGQNYLIDVPAGQKADVQIYNPSFAPDSNDQNGAYSYHEDDGSFPDGSTTDTDYSAMAYTVFTAPILTSRLSDSKVSQEVFYPYNATCLYNSGSSCNNKLSYYWFPTSTGSQTTVKNYTPATFHRWISAIQYYPSNSNDKNLYNHALDIGSGTYLDNSTGTVDKYWRLEVDNEAWNGQATCKSNTCTTPSTRSSSDSSAHKGYSVRVVNPGTSTCTSCGSISAMSDMTIYTPINSGSSRLQFSIPLFKLDAAYGGRTVTVDVFDPGDVGGGAAYLGIQLPASSNYATASSMVNVGNSLGSGGTNTVASLGTWPGTSTSCSACFQTAGNSGGAIYNGQWIQMQISVPSSFNSGSYWNLVYSVAAGVTAGDTLAVQAGYSGSPDHLLP